MERNALRAHQVATAPDWRWSSLWVRDDRSHPLRPFSSWPVERPARWTTLVNEADTEDELAALRCAVARGRPYGDDRWTIRTAKSLGAESSLRPIGRPKKTRTRKKGL